MIDSQKYKIAYIRVDSKGNDENDTQDGRWSGRLDNHSHDFIICAQMLSGHEAFYLASVSEEPSCHEESVYDGHANFNAEKSQLTFDVIKNCSISRRKGKYG